MVMQGAQGLFEAHDKGNMTLEVTGDPFCLKATPRCGMPSILLSEHNYIIKFRLNSFRLISLYH
jgi:hypothetical protein